MLRITMCAAVLLVAARVWAQGAPETVEGYAEFRKGAELLVDGQRIRATSATKFKGATTLAAIPLGFEVKVEGMRLADGAVQARTVEAKPNGSAMFEADTLAATNQMEKFFLDSGTVPAEPADHRLFTRGPQVERVRGIATRLIPAYKAKDDFRFYVVDDTEWNAFATANGMVVVNQGLLKDMDDDEIAIILGHELAHATHEHSRRERKRNMFVSLAVTAGAVTAGQTSTGLSRAAAVQALNLAGLAASNGYGRDLEDQADRVGLRYAYEAGFDVTKGPNLWHRFKLKYGDRGKVSSFFLSDHSRSSVRADNIRRQMAMNYPELMPKLAAAEAAAAAGTNTARPAPPASPSPLAGKAAPDAAAFDVWADRTYSAWDNPLHTELAINGTVVDLFSSDRTLPVGEFIQPGWNTVTLKTTADANVTQANGLRFRIGPARPGRSKGERHMEPVLWEFRNDADWSLSGNTLRHRLGPAVKELTLSIPLYYAGLTAETRKAKVGDYILSGRPQYGSLATPITATVWVNGTPLSTFTSNARDVVITPLLRPGRNEIKVASRRIAGIVQDNDIEFMVFGPVEWNVQQNTHVGPQVLTFGSMQGWTRDAKTGELTSGIDAAADQVERVIPLLLKALPEIKGGR